MILTKNRNKMELKENIKDIEEDKREEAIIGIDPGTTTAYAMVGISKDIIKVGSSKDLGLNRLIKETISDSIPLVVCSDKKHTPKAIEKYAAKTGAKIISPKKDLTTEEKKSIIKDYESKIGKKIRLKNDHEKDALASALFAYKKTYSLIKKLVIFEKKSKSKSHMIRKMVIKDNIAIKHAAKIAENSSMKKAGKKTGKDEKHIEKQQRQAKSKKENISKEIKILKAKNRELAKKIRQKEKDIEKLKKYITKQKKSIEKKIDKRTRALRENIKKLYKKSKEQSNAILKTKKEKDNIISILKRIDEYIVIKKIKNVGETKEKAKKGEIREKDYVFIEDSSSISAKSIKELKKITSYVLVKKDNKMLSKNFIVINISRINEEKSKHGIIEEKDIILIKKPIFNKLKENAIKKSDILARIIEEYKELKETAAINKR